MQMFYPVRRFKQALSPEDCVALLKNETRAVLSVVTEDGYPYGAPVNHWYNEADGKIYFHGGKLGHKVDCMKANDLPVRCQCDAATLAKAALSDKKRSGGKITLVLPDAIGKCHLEKVPVTELPLWFERALTAQEALKL
jgi:hypothetical protein